MTKGELPIPLVPLQRLQESFAAAESEQGHVRATGKSARHCKAGSVISSGVALELPVPELPVPELPAERSIECSN